MSDPVYGSVAGVAALASTWTLNGEFVNPDVYQDGSNPPLATVEDWLGKVCNYMNLALKEAWFVTPVDPDVSPDAYGSISEYVNSLVTDLVAARNSHGRFFTDQALNSRLTRWAQIQKDLRDWIAQNADGLVADNVPQIPHTSAKSQISVMVLGNH